MLVLSWNLFHGRADPVAGRPLLAEFARAIAGWDWDVALLQEVPPWWPPLLARAGRAQQRTRLTSRIEGLALRRAIASRNPDLLGANGGGANAILVRGEIVTHRSVRLTWRPERRWAHGVELADGTWMANLHVTTEPKGRTDADIAVAVAAAGRWAGRAPLLLGGDFNRTRPAVPGFAHLGGLHVDHLFARGLAADGALEVLDAAPLSDHRPIRIALRRV